MRHDPVELVFGVVVASVIVPVFIGILFVMLWITPHHVANEKKCLERGYPVTSTTWDGAGYCMTLDGTITVPVIKLP